MTRLDTKLLPPGDAAGRVQVHVLRRTYGDIGSLCIMGVLNIWGVAATVEGFRADTIADAVRAVNRLIAKEQRQ